MRLGLAERCGGIRIANLARAVVIPRRALVQTCTVVANTAAYAPAQGSKGKYF